MLQKFVAELRKVVCFKNTTCSGDLVLIAADNPRMLVYALVESIDPDPGRKGTWWNVQMHLLTVPPQTIVWTLREPQFTGQEIFTMGGEERFMQAVQFDDPGAFRDISEHDLKEENSSVKRPFRRLK